MLSEDRRDRVHNVVYNFTQITMGAMMNMVEGAMSGFAQAMAEAFSAAADGAADDIQAQIRASASEQMLEMFQEEPEMDEAEFQRHCQAITDEDVDDLAEKIEALAIPLPPFTQKLTPESLLGYYYLAQKESSQVGELLSVVGDWMQVMEEKKM